MCDTTEVVFGEALANHEKKFNANKMGFKHNMEKTETWKMALLQVANLSGYHFNGYHYNLLTYFLHSFINFNSSNDI